VVLVLAVLAADDSRGDNTDPEAKQVFTNSIGMKFVLIPAGEFLMGSPKDEEGRDDDEKQHRVRITNPFYLGVHEVTVGDFRQFVTDTGYKTDAEKDGLGGGGWNETKDSPDYGPKYAWRNVGFRQTDRHPVVNVSWNDAVAFCRWLSTLEGRTYRLPREAEWEYACRAGTTTRFYCGDDEDCLTTVGNVADASLNREWPREKWGVTSSDGYAFTSPSGSFRPNDLGAYDMHGNVWEWCQDRYSSHLPPPPGAAGCRMTRGGGWSSPAIDVRSACRLHSKPNYRQDCVGFRCALVPASQGK